MAYSSLKPSSEWNGFLSLAPHLPALPPYKSYTVTLMNHLHSLQMPGYFMPGSDTGSAILLKYPSQLICWETLLHTQVVFCKIPL